MAGHDGDLGFPACCTCCPHLQPVTTSCTHDLRQSLALELDRGDTCPVYARRKTAAMRQLAEDPA